MTKESTSNKLAVQVERRDEDVKGKRERDGGELTARRGSARKVVVQVVQRVNKSPSVSCSVYAVHRHVPLRCLAHIDLHIYVSSLIAVLGEAGVFPTKHGAPLPVAS